MKKHITRLYSSGLSALLILILLISSSSGAENDFGGYQQNGLQLFSSNYDYTKTNITPEILLDNEYVTITTVGVDCTLGSNVKLELSVFNKTNSEFVVMTKEFSVNGYAVPNAFAAFVGGKQTETSIMTLDYGSLVFAEIGQIAEMNMKFYIYDHEKSETLFLSDTVTIDTGSRYQQQYKEFEGIKLYNNGEVKIELLDVDYSHPDKGPLIYLYIENNSSQSLYFSLRHFYVYDIDVQLSYGISVPANMRSVSCVNSWQNLNELGILTCNEMIFDFDIFTIDYHAYDDPDPVTVTIE
ncbi:MAG: hypothetical protein JXN65_09795 [Clostridia bacterium]|nr:hypothetical protein [Clostridia bacterium]